jgi:hypothetical protein
VGVSTGMLSAGPSTPYPLEVRSMRSVKRRGSGPSSLLVAPDHAGNVVGIDPHKRTLTASVADARGGILASAHFRVSGEGHRELEAWARQLGRSLGGGSRGRRAGVGIRRCS